MPLSETELQQMSYREVVELAKVNGVYQKKSAKKAALIRRLSTVWTNDEFTGIENVDPNRTAVLTPLKEVDESLVSGSDCEDQGRRLTFTKVKKAAKRKTSNPQLKSTDPLNRRDTFTKSDPPDSSISKTEEAPSFKDAMTNEDDEDVAPFQPQKVTRASKKKTSQENKTIASLTRQNTFTKEDDSSVAPVAGSPKPTDSPSEGRPTRRNTFTKEGDSSLAPVAGSPKPTDSPSEGRPTRRNTFTKVDGSSLASVDESPKPTDSPSEGRPTRRNTFTKEDNLKSDNDAAPSSSKKSKRGLAENEGNLDETKSLVREGTFTKTPEKKESEIPVLQLNIVKTPAAIEKLSVFQRLSAKISLSERRSLVTSEKRVSVKTSFYTPRSDKRTQLNALRAARKNHITPRNIAKKMTVSALKTPVQPIMKSSATSTKKSSVKKPPNFAEIHKRNFAKMESLLEHKNRLRERADFMSPARRVQASSSIPKHNEGLLKSSGKKSHIPILQKKMATKDRLKVAMANKCPTGAVMHAKDKKILKGVRTNKRFELQLALKQKKAS